MSQRRAIVTGGGRGIGRAISTRFLEEGFAVEAVGLDDAELREFATSAPAGALLRVEALDLTDREATDEWLSGVLDRGPNLDVLVHNAGLGGPDPDDDAEALAHLERVLAINAEAPLRITRALAPALPEDGRGRVIVIASVLGKMGVPGFSAYGASKAAAIGLVRALARDLAPRRITVNAVCPGWTDTAMARQGFEAIATEAGISPEEARAEVERGLALGRIVAPEEVADLVLWLASPAAAAMTGQALTMSAGDLQR